MSKQNWKHMMHIPLLPLSLHPCSRLHSGSQRTNLSLWSQFGDKFRDSMARFGQTITITLVIFQAGVAVAIVVPSAGNIKSKPSRRQLQQHTICNKIVQQQKSSGWRCCWLWACSWEHHTKNTEKQETIAQNSTNKLPTNSVRHRQQHRDKRLTESEHIPWPVEVGWFATSPCTDNTNSNQIST